MQTTAIFKKKYAILSFICSFRKIFW